MLHHQNRRRSQHDDDSFTTAIPELRTMRPLQQTGSFAYIVCVSLRGCAPIAQFADWRRSLELTSVVLRLEGDAALVEIENSVRHLTRPSAVSSLRPRHLYLDGGLRAEPDMNSGRASR